jgi:hypothetical protein
VGAALAHLSLLLLAGALFNAQLKGAHFSFYLLVFCENFSDFHLGLPNSLLSLELGELGSDLIELASRLLPVCLQRCKDTFDPLLGAIHDTVLL